MTPETPSEPRQRRHRQNLTRIVDAASRVVFEEGLDALSVKRVADLADYTPGALYRYFPSKDALLAAVLARVLEDLGASLRAAMHGVDAPLGRVVRAAYAYRAFAAESPHGFALVASLLGDPRYVVSDDASAADILHAAVAVAVPVAGALAEAGADGDLAPGDAQARALALFAALQGAMLMRKYERRFPAIAPPDVVFDTLLRAVLLGFGARPAALDSVLATVTQGTSP